MSQKTQHTPGLWRFQKCVTGTVIGTEYPRPVGFQIAIVAPEGGFTTEEELANAALIAAAPELLEVVERALAILHPNTKWTKAEKEREWPIWEASARAAIAKAGGAK